MKRGWAVAAVVVLGACGTDSPATRDSASPTTASAPVTTAPATTTTPAPAPATTATTRPAPTTTARATDDCAVARQTPPTATVAATFPTAVAFAPDGRLFFTERAGTIKVFQDGAAKVFGTVAASTAGERGLLGLAVSPSFATDRLVYTFHSARNGTTQEVVRWTDCAGVGRNPEVVVELPAGSGCCHKGGRLAFGPDGKLYVTLGEQSMPAASANTADVRGKILRYNPDGSIPADNPYGNAVWASGFRNPFGLAISPAGRVAVIDNGPSGDAGSPGTGYDLVYSNVTRGSAGQWPSCYGYSRPLRGASCTGEEPDWSSETQTLVPTGAEFVNASGPAPYAGKLVFCTLNDGMKVVTDGSPHATVTDGDGNCRLDVTQGPDNALYVADTDSIHRVG